MKTSIRAILLSLFAVGFPLTACNSEPAEVHDHAEEQTLYRCPMHPQVTSDTPGDCPICNMRLVKVNTAESATSVGETGDMQMGKASGNESHEGHEGSGMSDGQMSQTVERPGQGMGPDDRADVHLDTRKRQLIGVRTAPVKVTDVSRSIRTVGFVEADENRVHHIHTKLEGWVENPRVRAVGEPVKKGQVLFELYSPQLVATQEELLAAIQSGNTALAKSARRRLRNWDLSAEEIAKIEKQGKPSRTLPFRSPMSGFVQDLKAVHGMYVKEMTTLYTIMNLSEIWVQGKFYESDLPYLEAGAKAQVLFPSGRSRTGIAEFVYPTIDPKTRFATVRFTFPNEDLALRPGMYVDLDYEVDLGPGLFVPRDAVIRTGSRAIAFVESGPGHFEPRELDLGPEVDAGYVVYGGLDDGEKVATQGNFFIDSESALQSAISKFGGAAGGHQH